MLHTCSGEPLSESTDALPRPASNNMPLFEHDTQELPRLLYLRAEGIERQERLQYLKQTSKSSIWSEEDDDSYTLPDPEIPVVYSLHYGQQCPREWDDGSVPAETPDQQKKKEHGKSNLHAEEDFLQKMESQNLDPRLKKRLLTYVEVFGALLPPLSCRKLVLCSRIGFRRCLEIHMVVFAAHSSILALLYLRVFLVFDYGSWIPAFIP